MRFDYETHGGGSAHPTPLKQAARPHLRPSASPADIDHRFRRPLYSFFRQRGCTYSVAEDLAQEVFLRFFCYQQTNEVKNLHGFIFQIAANLLCDLRRSRRRQPVESIEDLEDEDMHRIETVLLVDYLTPERVLEGRQNVETVVGALGELEARTLNMFVLYRIDEMRHREIADRMGVSVSLVEKSVCQARTLLERRTAAATL